MKKKYIIENLYLNNGLFILLINSNFLFIFIKNNIKNKILY